MKTNTQILDTLKNKQAPRTPKAVSQNKIFLLVDASGSMDRFKTRVPVTFISLN
jgi:uncharacterized protein with von Willebrand factor type A (vWA) domain